MKCKDWRYKITIIMRPVIGRLSKSKLVRRGVGRPYVVLSKWIWRHLPGSVTSSHFGLLYGRHCQGLVRLQDSRQMSIGTFFLRNRPELECLRQLVDQRPRGSSVSLTVLACSKGAEVYSLSFMIRSARPDLNVAIQALDIAQDVLEFAQGGVYSLQDLGSRKWPDRSLIAEKGELAWNTWRGQDTSIFERMTADEMGALFDREGDQVTVKRRFSDGITWRIGNATDPQLVNLLGPQDIVMAKNFLCHMSPADAEECLRIIPRLIKPGGYLCVSGVDLGVRTRVAVELGWKPVTLLLREIHDGDPSLRLVWPWNYCGLEPFDASRADWKVRYASVFQVGEAAKWNHR